ncbi:MAG: hypothetical protein A2Y67_00080 [Candidatus Buchananbacteria bacterium RBG_13_39_9]|uniref:VWFA domain-containing protein n=1 Tax=Candidatus Buchananbacteria bacterium RBG_13_39_9 TaxID=1797531 RepID=A0A1G1XTB7_9BACT|nr:MAG: hypothetical protein A2Y67_00080 [Candidatus Buchananbacteria bacterium RBG_13_39_9]
MSKKRKGSKAIKLPLTTLKTKARLALDSPALVEIAGSANSPNAAYEQAYLETDDVKLRRACQELARIKRDYGKKAFADLVSSVVSHRPRPEDPGKSKEGESVMKPKGQVKEVKPGTQTEAKKPQIPLKHIAYRAVVNGAFARISVVQKYKNDAANPVEAVYVFPLPDESTVTGCKMKINKRTITAELKAKEQARKEYDAAVSSGHHGMLMEQERPNIFEMNVGGIEPGEDIEVQITYVQQISWQDGGGRFRIPLVVAPRFIPGTPTGKSGTGWADDTAQVPDASKITPVVAREGVPYNADIQVLFRPGFRCELSSPSHGMLIPTQTVAKDQEPEFKTGDIKTDRDFILVYRSLSKRPEVAQFCHQTKAENFSQVSIIPPGEAEAKESEIVVLLDISGSMKGPKLAGLKTLAKKMLLKIKGQNSNHRVCVTAFEDRVHPLSQGMGEITEELFTKISNLTDLGGTELGDALTFAHQQFENTLKPHLILLITDGETYSINYQGTGARIITAGIDTAVNDELLRKLARDTNGACQFFYPGEDFDRAANTLIGMLSGPVLRDIKVSGAEAVGITDVFTGRPATIALRLGKDVSQKVTISGTSPSGETETWEINPTKGKECDFLPQIWAREAIRECHEQQKQVELSLKYNIICAHTSFVGISEKEVPGQKPVKVAIPVELPFTWNYDEVFGSPRSIGANLASLGIHSGGLRSGGGMKGIRTHSLIGSSLGSPRGFNPPDHDAPETFGFMAEENEECIEEVGDICCCLGDDDDDQGASLGGSDEILPTFEELEALLGANAPTKPTNPIISKLINILITADKGDQDKAQAELDKLTLTAKEIKSWSEEDRAMLHYFVYRLKAYGLYLKDSLKDNVYKALGVDPQYSDPIALAWKNLTKKELGFPYADIQTPEDYDWHEWICWKSGRGPKPALPPFALVP